jgi:hypothetical protein
MNSFKIQWNHLVYKDTFYCNVYTRIIASWGRLLKLKLYLQVKGSYKLQLMGTLNNRPSFIPNELYYVNKCIIQWHMSMLWNVPNINHSSQILTYDKLIMKIVWRSFIHRFINFTHEYHRLKHVNTLIYVLMNGIQTYKWTKVTWIFAFSYKSMLQMCFQCMILVCKMYKLWMNKFSTISIIKLWDAKFVTLCMVKCLPWIWMNQNFQTSAMACMQHIP